MQKPVEAGAARRAWPRPSIAMVLLGLFAVAPLVAMLLDQLYYLTFLSRVMILGLAAIGLNSILGFGGMTSLGHAAFVGIGAYTVGLLMMQGVTNIAIHTLAVVGVGAVAALAIGAVCLRTGGLAFIMLTLAFAQLVYYIGAGLKAYGGHDGFSFRGRSDLFGLGALQGEIAFYYYVFAWLLLAVLLLQRLVASRFGMALRAIRANEARAASIGLHPYRYKLAAFVISGVVCAVAGGLLANLTQFVSPAYMHWTRSAELLLIILLGDISTVAGPLAGAAMLLFLEEILAHLTSHWQAPLGLLTLALVILLRDGVSGVRQAVGRVFRRKPAAPAVGAEVLP